MLGTEEIKAVAVGHGGGCQENLELGARPLELGASPASWSLCLRPILDGYVTGNPYQQATGL